MTSTTNGQRTVIRTSRGLTVAGTRITLYTLLDYLHAGWPAPLVQDWFDLTDAQMTDVLDYITAYGDAVEQEYRQVVQQAEELRQYWDLRAQEHRAHRPPSTLTPEQVALRATFEVWKAQRKTP